ncbi:Diacylglycerol kinase family enzyme [Nitrosomonas sp. Nm51]|uniref:diacylglycerol/lipid kinase family protein n=1 Tax=Nitrosomonas sp. Nm51 TaxID=133720 RepID=UPI0008C0E99E|nr:diacylglycerol kinase family protein [Nitrosomonas sp. Nm51]SEQ86400.1 Diacylglycerol kinase family enzyme [Nitrosomonas sp. Nm51]
MTAEQLVILVNRKAGTARKMGHTHLLESLKVVNRPIQLQWLHPSELSLCIQKLVNDGNINELAVGGGDGTISRTIQHLVDTNIVLFPLPLGTMNHFVKDLNLPADLDNFLPLLNSHLSRRVDVGCVNNQFFLNNVSLGMYPRVVRYRSVVRFSQRFPKLIATAYALIKVLLRHQSRRAFTWCTNKGDDIKSPMFLVANNYYKFDMTSLVHRKRLDEGHLMIIAPADTKLSTLLEAILYAWTDRIEYARRLDVRAVKDIVINIDSDTTHAVIDGELTRLDVPIKLHMKKAALRVVNSQDASALSI